MSPDKYCSLVAAEGGLSMVEEILNDNSEQLKTNMEKVKDLAAVVRWVQDIYDHHTNILYRKSH